MSKKKDVDSVTDIYQLLLEASEKKRRERRAQLLKPLKVKEYFYEGKLSINKETCKGVECKLCIDACPTHALYWGSGEVHIVEDLCIFFAACVWSCIVDNCVQVWRKRPDGEMEEFSNPKSVLMLMYKIIDLKRRERVKSRMEWAREILPLRKTRVMRRFSFFYVAVHSQVSKIVR